MTLTLGSLFDGIGGFPLAAIRQGITPLWASEIEPFPIQVTKHHFPEMLHVGDITRLDGAKLPPVDIICGGSPCQDLSVASCTRAGLAGVRSGLFLEQIRVTKEMRDADIRRGRTGKSVRPRWFCWENVPGVFSSGFPKGEDFWFVLEQIAGIAGNSIPFTRPHPWGWQPAGKLRVGAAFSLGVGGASTLNTGPAPPSGDAGCSLSRILQDNPPRKYYLTRRACLGILRRATERVKPLPSQLHAALLVQAGLISQDNISPGKEASGLPSLLGNCLTPWDTQQARIFTPDSVAPTVAGADGGGGRNPAGLLFAAGFLAGQGSAAGGIGYQPECSPTLKAAESGSNMVPSVLCLNDQGGSVMDCSENISGTQMELVRTKEQGHQPLVFENHGIDSRYTGPHPVAPTLSARAGTGGNNLPLALQPEPIMCICGNVIDRQPAMEATASGFRRMWPIP